VAKALTPVSGQEAFGIEVEIRQANGGIEVLVSGEIDLATSSRLQLDLAGLDERRQTVILDLAAVKFLDSTGLRALWTIRQQMASAGGALLIRSPSEAVMRVLKLTRLDRVFEFTDVGS
jgi:anti-sigma B factor antagonist